MPETTPTAENKDHTDALAQGPLAPRRAVPVATILTVFALAILLAALWVWKGLILLTFAAILVAIALRGGAKLLNRWTGIGVKLGVVLTMALLVLVAFLLMRSIGPAISAQFNELMRGLPAAWQQVSDWLDKSNIGSFIERQLEPSGSSGGSGTTAASGLPGIFSFLTGTITTVFGGVANVVLMLTMAIFLALDGPSYRDGALKLVPIPHRPRARLISDELDISLGRWMAGQAVDMAVVALLTGLGLWLLGMPLAMVLGLIAGLTNIIPYVGPFLSGAPAVLFALTQGVDMAVYVLLLFVAVQQLEGNLLMPLIQKYASDLPPVLSVMGIVAFGGLFGFAGILLATPLVLVLIVLVKRVYIEGILGDAPAPPAQAPAQVGG
ncbi:AI-2E family transporter [Paracoccus zhejiangensis]|uniref:AI-2E family transporter n=1 Tax=Paracoccus zhejiangensis TaxID=1077935 RepID=A0A2H5EXK2_9RHOB|nr:AI-2E family transporter [Paracoccus zhejiangensis]AUH64038.1 AI-2E family transporter [Paracoccus zhejiangensis]